MTDVQKVVLELEELTDVPPYSFVEFRDTLVGAAEHERISNGNVERSLCLMERATSVMIRTLNEGRPWEHIHDSAMKCAQRICLKSHTETRDATLNKLYEFLRNRIDATALSIMSERAMNVSNSRIWPHCSSIKRAVTVEMLQVLNEDIETNGANIKDALAYCDRRAPPSIPARAP